MVKVKFFGALRLALNESILTLEANSVGDLFDTLRNNIARLRNFDPKKYVIYVNDSKFRTESTRLSSGDVVTIMSSSLSV